MGGGGCSNRLFKNTLIPFKVRLSRISKGEKIPSGIGIEPGIVRAPSKARSTFKKKCGVGGGFANSPTKHYDYTYFNKIH